MADHRHQRVAAEADVTTEEAAAVTEGEEDARDLATVVVDHIATIDIASRIAIHAQRAAHATKSRAVHHRGSRDRAQDREVISVRRVAEVKRLTRIITPTRLMCIHQASRCSAIAAAPPQHFNSMSMI